MCRTGIAGRIGRRPGHHRGADRELGRGIAADRQGSVEIIGRCRRAGRYSGLGAGRVGRHIRRCSHDRRHRIDANPERIDNEAIRRTVEIERTTISQGQFQRICTCLHPIADRNRRIVAVGIDLEHRHIGRNRSREGEAGRHAAPYRRSHTIADRTEREGNAGRRVQGRGCRHAGQRFTICHGNIDRRPAHRHRQAIDPAGVKGCRRFGCIRNTVAIAVEQGKATGVHDIELKQTTGIFTNEIGLRLHQQMYAIGSNESVLRPCSGIRFQQLHPCAIDIQQIEPSFILLA